MVSTRATSVGSVGAATSAATAAASAGGLNQSSSAPTTTTGVEVCASGHLCTAPEFADLAKSSHHCGNCSEKMHSALHCGAMLDALKEKFTVYEDFLTPYGRGKFASVDHDVLQYCQLCINMIEPLCRARQAAVAAQPPAAVRPPALPPLVAADGVTVMDSVGEGGGVLAAAEIAVMESAGEGGAVAVAVMDSAGEGGVEAVLQDGVSASAVGDAVGDDLLLMDNIEVDDRIIPAKAWGEPDAELHFFEVEGVQSMANYNDRQGKKTRLNNKDSLWMALKKGTAGNHNIQLRGMNSKIPGHVVATQTWGGALTNALNYGMMSFEEQEAERIRAGAASKANKRKWASEIVRLHNNRPPQPLANGRAAPVVQQPDALEQALARARANGHNIPEEGGSNTRTWRAGTRTSGRTVEGASRQTVSDPVAIERARQAAGYDPQQAAVLEHRGLGSDSPSREALVDERRRANPSRRKLGVAPKNVGQQNDSNSRRFVNSAMKKVAKTIMGIHYEGGGDEVASREIPMHSMVLLVLNEVQTQTNDHGGKLQHKVAEKPKLTIIANDHTTCNRILELVVDQYSEDADDADAPRACTKFLVVKTEEMSLLENVEHHIAQQSRAFQQPPRSTESNEGVQGNMTPGARQEAGARPAYSTSRRTPATGVGEEMEVELDEEDEEGGGIVLQSAGN